MRSFNAAILSTISLTALLASSPAVAQTAAPVDTTPQKTQEGEQNPPSSTPTNAQGQAANTGGAIVVTGSRVRRNNFTTPQNIDVITRDDSILAGTRTTAETLQSATVTSGTSQINGSFLGFLSDNGQGANTVGLRGLGAARTLVLLNGRRLAPAGVGAQLVAADLNTLPSAVVQRIEVLREGASSVYGSDAIAGVINIITDTAINGVTIDAYADHPLVGAGDTLRGSITAGKTFSRGHIMASLEVRDDEGMKIGDRGDWSCPRELAFINGHEIGQLTPDGSRIRCFPYQRGGGGTPAGYGVGASFNGSPGSRLSFAGYDTGNPTLFLPPVNVRPGGTNFNPQPETGPTVLQNTVFSPIRTYTGYANGSYELGILGDAEIYGEGLYVRRKSHQDYTDRPDFQSVPNRFTSAQLYGGFYAGPYTGGEKVPVEAFGYPVSPFFPVAWANAGYNYFGAFIMPNRTFRTKQKVDFWRANGGLRGNLGIGDWRYDGNIQLSRTHGRDDRTTPLTMNLANSLVAVEAPSGTPGEFTAVGLPGQVGAGITYTCKSNITNGAYNGGDCVPFDSFDPAAVVFGQLPDALVNYVYQNANYTKTTYNQNTFSLALDGSLFRLQGGDVKAAIGLEHRSDHIDDTPGALRQQTIQVPGGVRSGLYYYGPAAETVGSDKVSEAYAEVDLPIFKDLPFANLLEIEGSGRYTHYQSYGSGWTYHVNAQYAPIQAIRFRGNYGTNFRAPNLYEQFVADEVGFYGVDSDPCANFGVLTSPGSTTYNNCLAALTPVLGSEAAALKFNPPGGSIPVTTKGGRGVVKAETAKTYGFGTVISAPRSVADLSLAVDYWHVLVKGEVSTLGNLILNFCFTAEDYPNNPYCALVGPRLTIDQVSNKESAGVISTFDNPYLNIAQQLSAGIDFDARYATRVFGGRFSTQLQATHMLKQSIEFFPGQGLQNFNGTLGYPGFGSGPKWVGSLDTRFTTSNNITLRWGVKYVGKQNSQAGANPLFLTENNVACQEGSPGCFPVHYKFTADPYWEHGLSVQWLWPKIGQFTIGVNNVFNNKPPVISDDQTSGFPRIGNYFGSGAYDYRGRSVFANITKSF